MQFAGARLTSLPAYSPGLNPIDKMWSKVKNSFRSQEVVPRQALSRYRHRVCAGHTRKRP